MSVPLQTAEEATQGLSTAEAARRLAADGRNELPAAHRTPPWRLLVAQMTHLFALMLWVAAGLAMLAGLAPLALAIVVIIVLNGVFAFAQEYRADQAAQRLRDLLPARVQVRRDGQLCTVDVTELVHGDLVLLTAGDKISADLELRVGHGLAVDESMLTGESVPVRPRVGGRGCRPVLSWSRGRPRRPSVPSGVRLGWRVSRP